jgi:hypothetical protein
VVLNSEKDHVTWKQSACRKFSVKTVYDLTREDDGPDFKRIWKAKLPAKIKTFMWLVEQRAILTKDNMLKRNWYGNPGCYFCESPETMDHLFFESPVAKVVWGVLAICLQQSTRPVSYEQFWHWIPMALPMGQNFHMLGLPVVCCPIWKTRNKVCFDKKPLRNPNEILLYACALVYYWAGMYPEDAVIINSGVDIMMKTALKLLGKNIEGLRMKSLMGVLGRAHDDQDVRGAFQD